jgi:hypothetical protein
MEFHSVDAKEIGKYERSYSFEGKCASVAVWGYLQLYELNLATHLTSLSFVGNHTKVIRTMTVILI